MSKYSSRHIQAVKLYFSGPKLTVFAYMENSDENVLEYLLVLKLVYEAMRLYLNILRMPNYFFNTKTRRLKVHEGVTRPSVLKLTGP